MIKYVRRIVLVLVIFAIPMAGMIRVFDSHRLYPTLIPEMISDMIQGLSFGHLWYIYCYVRKNGAANSPERSELAA